MTAPIRLRRGCSPFAYLGCGCGLIAALGILFIFFILTMQMVHARRDARWEREPFAQCQDNVNYLKKAIISYERDHGHPPATLNELRGQYLDRPSRLRCPLEIRELGTHYHYNPNATRPDAPFITCTNHGQGPIVLLRDGRLDLPNMFGK